MRDPIKSLVDCGIGDDVDTVIVDGVVRMENGRIPGIDFAELRAQAQAAGERVWSGWQNWDPHRPHGGRDEPLFLPARELMERSTRPDLSSSCPRSP